MSTQANLARASEEPSKNRLAHHIEGPENLGTRMHAFLVLPSLLVSSHD